MLKSHFPEAAASICEGLPLPHGASEEHQTQQKDPAMARCILVANASFPYVGSLCGGQHRLSWEAEWMRVCWLWENLE